MKLIRIIAENWRKLSDCTIVKETVTSQRQPSRKSWEHSMTSWPALIWMELFRKSILMDREPLISMSSWKWWLAIKHSQGCQRNLCILVSLIYWCPLMTARVFQQFFFSLQILHQLKLLCGESKMTHNGESSTSVTSSGGRRKCQNLFVNNLRYLNLMTQ